MRRTIEKVVTKSSMHSQVKDISYWKTRNYAERLVALEEIRREYNDWKYTDAEQRFQRILRVSKLKER